MGGGGGGAVGGGEKNNKNPTLLDVAPQAMILISSPLCCHCSSVRLCRSAV